jgi:hypothetical protein
LLLAVNLYWVIVQDIATAVDAIIKKSVDGKIATIFLSLSRA